MKDTNMCIGLLEIGHVGQEAIALRATLEYFGYRVVYYPVARPKDLIVILNKTDLYQDVSTLIISAHGEAGEIILPELAKAVYEADEPVGNFGPDEIMAYAQLEGVGVLTTGCGLGLPVLGEAFIKAGAAFFIGPTDDIDGNAALLFVQHFFYQIKKGQELHTAFESASKVDQETAFYRLYTGG